VRWCRETRGNVLAVRSRGKEATAGRTFVGFATVPTRDVMERRPNARVSDLLRPHMAIAGWTRRNAA
jgi:hypothetical protein